MEDGRRTDAAEPATAAQMFDIEPPEPSVLATVVPDPRQAPPPRRAQVVGIEGGTQPGRTQAVERMIVRHSDEIAELVGALAVAQGMFEDLERTRTARIESARAKYSFDFETLADVIAATKTGLSQNGLAVMQFPFPTSTERGDFMTLRTMLAHKSGQWIYNDLLARLEGGLEPKSVGSGITYLQRYARKAILGVAASWDDDDATAASAPPQRQGAPQPAQRVKPQPEAQRQPVPQAEAPKAAPAETQEPAALRSAPGLVAEVGEQNAICAARLDNGFIAATRDTLLMAQLNGHRRDAEKGLGRPVVFVCKPPSDPKRFRPTLIGIEIQSAAEPKA